MTVQNAAARSSIARWPRPACRQRRTSTGLPLCTAAAQGSRSDHACGLPAKAFEASARVLLAQVQGWWRSRRPRTVPILGDDKARWYQLARWCRTCHKLVSERLPWPSGTPAFPHVWRRHDRRRRIGRTPRRYRRWVKAPAAGRGRRARLARAGSTWGPCTPQNGPAMPIHSSKMLGHRLHTARTGASMEG